MNFDNFDNDTKKFLVENKVRTVDFKLKSELKQIKRYVKIQRYEAIDDFYNFLRPGLSILIKSDNRYIEWQKNIKNKFKNNED